MVVGGTCLAGFLRAVVAANRGRGRDAWEACAADARMRRVPFQKRWRRVRAWLEMGFDAGGGVDLAAGFETRGRVHAAAGRAARARHDEEGGGDRWEISPGGKC